MKYYDIYEVQKVKDSRGNLKESFVKVSTARGEILTKENSSFQQEQGKVIEYSKLFITTKTYQTNLKIGNKIDEYLIRQVLEYNNRIVCLLTNVG